MDFSNHKNEENFIQNAICDTSLVSKTTINNNNKLKRHIDSIYDSEEPSVDSVTKNGQKQMKLDENESNIIHEPEINLKEEHAEESQG